MNDSNNYLRAMLMTRVYEVAHETPLQPAPALSAQLRNEILIKREDLQVTHSFKVRGAYQKITTLSANRKRRGIIAASAGNHAQGVALAATRMGLRAVIVLPTGTCSVKIDGVRLHGGEVVMHGTHFYAAYDYARLRARQEGLTLIHPYDDVHVIAGQGTVGLEMARQCDASPFAVFVPVGGGGLIAGMALALKQRFPKTRIIGVQAHGAACLFHALRQGRRVRLRQVDGFADGTAVSLIGKEPFRIARQLVDRVITVDQKQICAAIRDLFHETRAVAEPAGALALAGLKRFANETRYRDKKLIAVLSGANLNFEKLGQISQFASCLAGTAETPLSEARVG